MALKIAHRGGAGRNPENTLKAFEEAIRLGADIVEFDVRLTKDGEIVVMHDENVTRTTDGMGLVQELTLQEIKKFHTADGRSVPTLQEAFDVLKGRCICKIDIRDWSSGLSEKLFESIRDNQIEDKVIIASGMYSVLKEVRELMPKVKIELGALREKFSVNKMVAMAKRFQVDIIAPHYSVTTKELVTEAHKNGLEVHAWTMNKKEDIENMKKMGVDGITTDYPEKI